MLKCWIKQHETFYLLRFYDQIKMAVPVTGT
jgi:hypothetical protein